MEKTVIRILMGYSAMVLGIGLLWDSPVFILGVCWGLFQWYVISAIAEYRRNVQKDRITNG